VIFQYKYRGLVIAEINTDAKLNEEHGFHVTDGRYIRITEDAAKCRLTENDAYNLSLFFRQYAFYRAGVIEESELVNVEV